MKTQTDKTLKLIIPTCQAIYLHIDEEEIEQLRADRFFIKLKDDLNDVYIRRSEIFGFEIMDNRPPENVKEIEVEAVTQES